ncbi:MAG: UbiA family prenyltransferase [Candidatus Hydrothermarchaeales archaeon]
MSDFYMEFLKLIRFKDWFGGLISFLIPVIFLGAINSRAAMAAIAFCLVMASVFIFNQYCDIDTDTNNEVKSKLPLTSGAISKRMGLLIILCFLTLGFGIAYSVDKTFFVLLVVLKMLGVLYSAYPFRLKSRPGFDIVANLLGMAVIPYLAGWSLIGDIKDVSMLLGAIIILVHVWAHILQQVRDYEADKRADLKTVVVFLGKKRSYHIADILVFISIALYITACIYGPLNVEILIVSLASIPFTLPLFYSIRRRRMHMNEAL